MFASFTYNDIDSARFNVRRFIKNATKIFLDVQADKMTFSTINNGGFELLVNNGGSVTIPTAVVANIKATNSNRYRVISMDANSVEISVESCKAIVPTKIAAADEIAVPAAFDMCKKNCTIEQADALLKKTFEGRVLNTLTKNGNNTVIRIKEYNGEFALSYREVTNSIGKELYGTNTWKAQPRLPASFVKVAADKKVDIYAVGNEIYIKPSDIVDIFGNIITKEDAVSVYFRKMSESEACELREAVMLSKEIAKLNSRLEMLEDYRRSLKKIEY